jgi:hypothetical protein
MHEALCSPCCSKLSECFWQGGGKASIPCMTDTYTMVNVAERKLEQLICQDTRGISKAKERMVGKDGPQPHGPRMQVGLVTHAAQAAVAVDNLDALANEDVAHDGEPGEDGGEGGVTVDDEEGDVVDLEAVHEVADALAVIVGVGDDNDLVAAVYELARDLVDVRLDTARLGEEVVADHGDVVSAASHFDDGTRSRRGWGIVKCEVGGGKRAS